MKVSKNLFFLSFLFFSLNLFGQICLFQSGYSCCLRVNGVDVCNPNVPCTRSVSKDLSAIGNYVDRLLRSDIGDYEDREFLLYVQRYIRSLLMSASIALSYRFDINRQVEHYHDMIYRKKREEVYRAKKKKDDIKEREIAEKARKEREMLDDMKHLGLLVNRLKNKNRR